MYKTAVYRPHVLTTSGTSKTAKIMNGDKAAPCQCQRAAHVIN